MLLIIALGHRVNSLLNSTHQTRLVSQLLNAVSCAKSPLAFGAFAIFAMDLAYRGAAIFN